MPNEELHRKEIFLLYNESETGVEEVAAALRAADIPLYFARQDLPLGSDFSAVEDAKLSRTPVVLILLGEKGWGPTQRKIASRIEAAEERIIPALIGLPPEGALDDVGGLFRSRLYVDLRQGPAAMTRLVDTLRQRLAGRSAVSTTAPAGVPRFDEIMTVLLDGSDVDRALLLQRIQRGEISDRKALAARLRESLRTDYSQDQRNQETVARPTNWLPSIRSWTLSVLIWLDPETDETAKLLFRHLDPRHEPEGSVRFWVLAGIIQRRLSYLHMALQLVENDKSLEIRGLAKIARDPRRQSTLATFRAALNSREFDKAWPMLRILRIYPIPELAEDVVRLLEKGTTDRDIGYDALFALSHVEMTTAVRSAVLDGMGVRRLVTLVLRTARGVAGIARRAFAGVLSMFDLQDVRIALAAAAAASLEDQRVARNLLDEVADISTLREDGTPPTPGQANDDVDIKRDSIGIALDVRTLASVMLSREVQPPLAIGLFGEWGSGKSFYIKSIEAEVNRIAHRASTNQSFCANVVQIHFNAWHYVDSNLWASLVSHLLDGLAAYLTPRQTLAEQRSALTRELTSAKEEMATAQEEQRLASSQLEVTVIELEQKTSERQARELKLHDFRLRDLKTILEGDAELKNTLDGALAALGAPAAIDDIRELNDVLKRSRSGTGRIVAFVHSIFNCGNRAWMIGGIVALLALPPALGYLIQHLMNEHLGTLSAIAAQVSVIAVSATAVLRKALAHATAGLDRLSDAKKKVDAKLAEKRSRPSPEELKLEEELVQARASEKAAAERVALATGRAQELEARVAALIESQSLGFFVSERMRSDDYRRHLGLISTIRRDFESLIERIQSSRDGDRPVERIILYIDDVDRCPPDMVVDILQAVHLLLAYKLFVVVVSVDPRWLLHSLGSRISQLQQGNDEDSGLIATPQDYLEKIFQIPFTVRPMGQQGFAKLMQTLFGPDGATDNIEQPQTAVPQTAREPREQADVEVYPEPAQASGTVADSEGDPTSDPTISPSESAGSPTLIQPDADTLAELPAEQLVIRPGEVEFAAMLHEVLATPRSAKRFANIYRLLKASVPRGELARFEGTQAVRGDFQLPMLLVALIVGRSSVAEKLFPHLLTAARAGRTDWWAAGWEATGRSGDDRLRRALDPLVASSFFPHSPDLAVEWLPKVSRYSFTTARVFLEAV